MSSPVSWTTQPPLRTSSPAAPKAKIDHIPEILEEHYEEVQFLWARRRGALRSSRFMPGDLSRLDERIEAHVQGMLATGDAVRRLVEPDLFDGNADSGFASAFALLRQGEAAATRLVIDCFLTAEGKRLDGLREALCCVASEDVLRELEEKVLQTAPPVAAAALEVLACRAPRPPRVGRVRSLLGAEDPAARATAWRVLATLGVPAEAKEYSAAMRDDEKAVRDEAIAAAVWARVPGILTLARQYAERPSGAHLLLYRLLAVLGAPGDRPAIDRLHVSEAPGPRPVRLALVGMFGHPSHIEMLIGRMAESDAATAVAAGQAFTRMTGADVTSSTRDQLPPAEPTGDAQLDAEFSEDVLLPDPGRARRAWSAVSSRLGVADRICRGEDISQGATAGQLATCDLASRWDAAMRNRFYGLPGPSIAELSRFPQ